MTYAIITGAHFFPYAWYYGENGYAVMAGIISAGSLIAGLALPLERMYFIPLFMVLSLIMLALLIFLSYRRKQSAFARG